MGMGMIEGRVGRTVERKRRSLNCFFWWYLFGWLRFLRESAHALGGVMLSVLDGLFRFKKIGTLLFPSGRIG